MTVPPRLSQLMELADQGPALRAALAEEVAELLLAWPKDYPEAMRVMCETLLAQAARDGDAGARAKLKAKLKSDPELAARVLPHDPPRHALIAAARKKSGLEKMLADMLDVATPLAEKILRDSSGQSLAVAAHAVHLGRSDFSALALLLHPRGCRDEVYALLDAYDEITPAQANRTLRVWRDRNAK